MKFIDGCSYLGSYKHSEIVNLLKLYYKKIAEKTQYCSEIKQSRGLRETLFFHLEQW